jgi:hypothetical protein
MVFFMLQNCSDLVVGFNSIWGIKLCLNKSKDRKKEKVNIQFQQYNLVTSITRECR